MHPYLIRIKRYISLLRSGVNNKIVKMHSDFVTTRNFERVPFLLNLFAIISLFLRMIAPQTKIFPWKIDTIICFTSHKA